SFHSRIPPPPPSTLFPYTTLFRSKLTMTDPGNQDPRLVTRRAALQTALAATALSAGGGAAGAERAKPDPRRASPKRYEMKKSIKDRKSTRLNSSHLGISYAVFCLK